MENLIIQFQVSSDSVFYNAIKWILPPLSNYGHIGQIVNTHYRGQVFDKSARLDFHIPIWKIRIYWVIHLSVCNLFISLYFNIQFMSIEVKLGK